jgi:hypothetical protein
LANGVQLDRESQHSAWPEQNLRHSQQVRNNRKKVLPLRNEMKGHCVSEGGSIQGEKK